MVFAVAILAVGTRTSISPAETGVVLSYMLVVQQVYLLTPVAMPNTLMVGLLVISGFWMGSTAKR